MEKLITMYRGEMTATYQETEEKRQQLWDSFIKWCQDHNASTGESAQNDDFMLDAPEFMADMIDNVVKFEASWEDDDDFF